MRHWVVAASLVALPGWVAHADPLKSQDCGAALAALGAARRDRTPAVEPLRSQAASACLGGGGQAKRPSPAAQAPIVVPPPVIARPQAPQAPRPPPAIPLPERPAFVTHCDTGGCWDSEGRRLVRSGPLLLGPQGACIAAGPAVTCP